MEKSRLVAALYAADEARPRSQQTAIGVSSLGGCRRQVWHKLRGDEGNNPTKRLAAIMGTAIHAAIEQAFAGAEDVLIEHRVEIEGLPPATIDFYDVAAGEVVDWKTKVSQEKAKPDQAWPLQLAGYHLLAQERYGVRLDGAMNLMIWPGGCQEVFWPPEKMAELRRRFIGHVAWAHAVKGAQGVADTAGALEHLLQLYPEALELTAPPAGHGAWTVAQVLGNDHSALQAC